MDWLATWLGNLLTPIIAAAVKEAVAAAFAAAKDTGEVGQQNPDLQQSWSSNNSDGTRV